MKVSLITVSWNSADVIEQCLASVKGQDYGDIEYIVIDGGSTDDTLKYVDAYKDRVSHCVSEPDEGIYDAMNKGLEMATGDIIGIINSDDLLAREDIISRVVKEFRETNADAIFGDIVYVEPDNLERVVRFFPGKGFSPKKMYQGFMPPHPSFYVKKDMYQNHGTFDTSFDICADFEFMVRLFLKAGISYSYIPETMVKMRTGGASTSGIKSNVKINQEMLRALRQNGFYSNYPMLYSRYVSKVFQLLNRPS